VQGEDLCDDHGDADAEERHEYHPNAEQDHELRPVGSFLAECQILIKPGLGPADVERLEDVRVTESRAAFAANLGINVVRSKTRETWLYFAFRIYHIASLRHKEFRALLLQSRFSDCKCRKTGDDDEETGTDLKRAYDAHARRAASTYRRCQGERIDDQGDPKKSSYQTDDASPGHRYQRDGIVSQAFGVVYNKKGPLPQRFACARDRNL
jgi:hypothetical protein